jgi:hypothetical protein
MQEYLFRYRTNERSLVVVKIRSRLTKTNQKMVVGIIGPCLLGAMAIVFVAFLAPTGEHILEELHWMK